MIAIEKAERAPYSEWWIDYLWNKVELGLYGFLLDDIIDGGGVIPEWMRMENSERLSLARLKGVISFDEARWMYLVSQGFALNSDVYDSVER